MNGSYSTDVGNKTYKYYNSDIRLYNSSGGLLYPSPADGIYEINGSRTEQFSVTEFTAHTEYICPWGLRFQYIDKIMDSCFNADVSYDESGNFIADAACFYAVYYPALPTSVSCAPFGQEGYSVDAGEHGIAGKNFHPYTKAKISVDYKGNARAGSADLQETITPSQNLRTLQSWGFYWQSDGSPVLEKEAPGVQELQVTIQRTLSGIRVIPPWFYNLTGCVNANAWTDKLTGITYLPGTLLFIASNLSRQETMRRDDDDNVWSLSYEITWNPIGWNKARRPSGIDQMMRAGKVWLNYPVAFFPTLLVDPNEIGVYQMLGDPYVVGVIDPRGNQMKILVHNDGSIETV